MKIVQMKNILFLLTFFLLSSQAFSQQKNTFKFSTDQFLLNGKPFQMISGEIHPSRVPREYWRHRIQMIKAMGCNTVSVYIMWNYLEPENGVFDFKTGNHDIAEFIRMCQQEGMWVLVRPGPYVCAEWDFGGIPTYLLKIPDIKIRCMDPRYMASVTRYIGHLAKELKPLQITEGGPVLMMQVENEYGSYGNDKEYLRTIEKLWVDNGINVPFFTGDGPTPYMLDAGTLPGAAIGLDSGSDEKDFAQAKKQNPNVPSFSSETYPGWLTHWGEKWAMPDTNSLKRQIEFLMTHKKSFNLYVIHGGTNFGFTAGANASSPISYQPDVTSYDYDAPINEQGRPTAKYFMLRRLISKYVDYKIPDVPKPISVMTIPEITMKKSWNLWDYKLPVIQTPQPRPMEDFDQNQGLIIYKTKLIGHKSGKLKIWEPHDYALVFLNGKFLDTVYRDGGDWEVSIPKTDVDTPRLEIVVEGMGHINFAQFMIDRKGITDRVTLNGMTLMNWETTLVPMDERFIRTQKPVTNLKDTEREHCNFFTGRFQLTQTADTYFDMSGYTKGVVYVNGHNLGRYWNIGPQFRLYCPASFLKRGENEIVVFDLLQNDPQPVSGVTSLYE